MKSNLIKLLILFSATAFSQTDTSSYFQQTANFNIKAKLNIGNHTIKGFETIEYTNHSGQILDTLYFHLWPNAYSDLSTAYAKEKIDSKDKAYINNQSHYKGNIEQLEFKVNNNEIQFYLHSEHKDIGILILNNPLLDKETITISTPFLVNIPVAHSRLGRSKNAYQISQWYPKPAVFDRDGWHFFPYRDIGEFYSEFGSYEVEITVPNNFTVASTGNLTHTENFDQHKTLTYKEDQIHDFAWFADNELTEDVDSVQLPHSKRWVKTMSYYNPRTRDNWKKANQYIKDAIYYYSLWLGDYPYKTCKAVLSDIGAGGGMEYPTITVIGGGFGDFDLETVIMHEVGHNWFYGILASNERDFPWMDESLNSAYETRYVETKYPDKISGLEQLNAFSYAYTKNDFYSYILGASRQFDQAGHLRSEQYSMFNYGTIVYKKDALIFNYLRHYLGDETFDRIMKIYFERWKFKHPQPSDLIAVFEEQIDEDLSWIFEDLLSTRKKMDYKIKSLKKKNGLYQLNLKNTKSIKAPVFVEIYKEDSLLKSIKLPGFKKDTSIQIKASFDKIYLDRSFRSLDLNRKNNYIRNKGLFKKTDAVKLSFVGSLLEEENSKIYLSPVMGFNTNNGFMFGAAFSSNLAITPQFEYLIMPMYAFNNNQLSGETMFEYHFDYGSSWIKTITPYASSKTYGISETDNYKQGQLGLEFNFQNFRKAYPSYHGIDVNYTAANSWFYLDQYEHFLNVNYKVHNKRWFNPFKHEAKLNIHKDFALLSLDLNQELTYSKPKTGFKLRFFAGYFLFNNSNNGQYNLSLSGTSGINDYQYEETFVGRTERKSNSLWAHQFVANEGGFTTYAPFSSNQWMSSLTLSSTLPFKSPFEFYFTIATFEGSDRFFEKGLAWESGLAINIIRDFAILYFPFTKLSHEQIQETNALYTDKYIEKIRFTLVLNRLNIKKLSKEIDQLF